MEDYIKSSNASLDKMRVSNEVAILKAKYFEKEPFEGFQFNPDFVFERVVKSLPSHFLEYIDTIIVGDFDLLNSKDLSALYNDGSIYLSNKDKDGNVDIIDDIIHEVAHAIEENLQHVIYGDNLIEEEFRAKRKSLYFLLKENGFEEEVDFYNFDKVEYDEQFDLFLYQEVSYSLLSNLTSQIVCSPYGLTSLREYFANCFEHYFYVNSPTFVKHISPKVHEKIERIINYEN